jgi:CubicO group peptidase (beta-lactamase class C family)
MRVRLWLVVVLGLSGLACAGVDSQRQKLRDRLAELACPPLGTGAALAISEGGRVVTLTEGALWNDGPRVREHSQFNVASVSKLLTAARIVSLAHEHRLGLDDSVKKHLPGVVLIDARGSDRAGEVTLRQLLMHRGGLPHQPDALDPERVGSDWKDPELLTRLTSSRSIRLAREPGTYGYSNLGYALLGAIIERTEGTDFASAMQAYLAELHMDDSTFWPSTLGERAARGRLEQDGSVRFNEPGWYTSRYALPFTGMWTSMPDLAHFGNLLAEATYNETAPLHEMTKLGTDEGHAAGPVVRRWFGVRTFEHDGAGPGFMAWLVVIPEREMTLAVASNGDGEARANARRMFELTEEMLAILLNRER